MTITGNIILNTLERVASADINDLQALAAGQLLAAELPAASQSSSVNGTADTRNTVGGFDLAFPAAVDTLEIAAGSVAEYAPTLPPAAGTYDSDYRVASFAAQTLPLPIPAGPTWYVLEARWVRDPVVFQVRDIKNPGTGLFVPTVVPKIALNSIEFQFVPGILAGPIPATSAPSTGWIPLYAIFRAGGSAFFNPTTEAWDLRHSESDARTRGYNSPARQAQVDWDCDGTNLIVDQTRVAGRLWGRDIEVAPGTYPLASLLRVGPGFAPSTTYYVYAYQWQGLPVRRPVPITGQPIANNTAGNAALVISPAPPVLTPSGILISPPGGIIPPGDFQNSGIVNGLLVGSVRRDPTNTFFQGQKQVSNRVWVRDAEFLEIFINPAGPIPWNPPAPIYRKTLDVRISWSNDSAAGPSQADVTSVVLGSLDLIGINRVPGVVSSRGYFWFTAVDPLSYAISAPVYSFGVGGNNIWGFQTLSYTW